MLVNFGIDLCVYLKFKQFNKICSWVIESVIYVVKFVYNRLRLFNMYIYFYRDI